MHITPKKLTNFAGCLLGSTMMLVLLAGAPAMAQKAPNAFMQEVLIKTTLLTFNDANLTGNYTVMHARLSKPFRDQFPPDKLRQAFKRLRDQGIGIDVIAAKKPILSKPAKVDDKGLLLLVGYFDTQPVHIFFNLKLIRSEGEWKPIGVNVEWRKPS